MLQIELMRWEQARAAASRIRYAVFVEEQGVPVEIELDGHDAECIHALAFDVTPSRLVTALVTERGVCPATAEGLEKLFPERAAQKATS